MRGYKRRSAFINIFINYKFNYFIIGTKQNQTKREKSIITNVILKNTNTIATNLFELKF
jgi:hypothetical protein